MKLKLSLLTAAISLSLLGTAQHVQRCASNDYLKELDKKYPGLEQYVKDLPKQVKHDKETRAETITIPVVVHIVYKNANENLTDDYITAQIDLLNKSYLRQNADTTNLRAEFKPFAGKAKIQFMLAQTIRTLTTIPEFTYTGGNNYADAVKVTAAGGSDAVSPDKKLNIWICDVGLPAGQGELLGYAYPPSGLPNWGGQQFPSGVLEGVVLDYMAVGGNTKLPKGNGAYGCKGKAAVHEVGHYLGLRHTWGDDEGACSGDPDFEDDGMNDTPHTADMSNFDCNKNKNTCNEAAGDLKDMVENYMDYSLETCQNTFTKDQVSLMESVLNNQRSQVRIPTRVQDLDFSANISVYPNPAEDQLHVALLNLEFETAALQIMNHLGQVVYTQTLFTHKSAVSIDVQNLPSGIYFLKVILDNKYSHNEKVLIH